MNRFRAWVGDTAAILCHWSDEKLWRVLHPLIEWGWKFEK